MRSIAIANQKGGVGKSTSVINLGAALVQCGRRVLLIDTDPQGHTTIGLGVSTKDNQTAGELICDDIVSVTDVIQHTYIKNLDIIPSDLSLAMAEIKLSTMPAKEFRLRNKLQGLESLGYDYVIFDCAPTFGALPMNVFTAAKEIILPLQLAYFSLEGVSNFMDTINFINKTMGPLINHRIELTGILLTFFDVRTKLSREIHASVQEFFKDKLLETTIPQNVKLNEAQSQGKSIFDYDPSSKGAIAYLNLAKEIIKGELHEQHFKNKPKYQKEAFTR